MPRPLDIIVPVLNEEAYIDEFCARVRCLGLADALVFVDNASTDRTLANLARHPEVRVIRHTRNEGYGASVRHAFTATDGEAIVIIDADLEYAPEAIPVLLAALEHHPVVYASRFLGPEPSAMPPLRRLGNRIVSALYSLLFRQHATDLYTGMKAFRRDALPIQVLELDGFEHGVELAAMIVQVGHHIHDVAVPYVPRTRGRSKMRHVPETLKLVAYLLGYWVRCRVLGRPLRGVRRS